MIKTTTCYMCACRCAGRALRNVKWLFLAGAFAVQLGGLLAERWFFFAQANHPQNLYTR